MLSVYSFEPRLYAYCFNSVIELNKHTQDMGSLDFRAVGKFFAISGQRGLEIGVDEVDLGLVRLTELAKVKLWLSLKGTLDLLKLYYF